MMCLMLMMPGDDAQIVQVHKGAPHGMCTTHKNQLNADLLAFIRT